MLELVDLDLDEVPRRLRDIEKAIEDMRHAGFGWGTYPMRTLHQNAIHAYLMKGNAAECLKLSLKIRFLIEPAQDPPTTIEERINTLYNLVSLLNFPVPGQTALDDLPLEIKFPGMFVMFHLRAKLAADTELCYGADSAVARFEKDFAKTGREHMAAEMRRMGREFHYTPLSESARRRRIHAEHMNTLFSWAGLPTLTFSELMI